MNNYKIYKSNKTNILLNSNNKELIDFLSRRIDYSDINLVVITKKELDEDSKFDCLIVDQNLYDDDEFDNVLVTLKKMKIKFNAKLIILVPSLNNFYTMIYDTFLIDYIFSLKRDYHILLTHINNISLESFRKSIDELSIEKNKHAIDAVLQEVGIPGNLSGQRYISYALLLLLENEIYIKQVTKVLYPKIAEKFNSTKERVERSIRNAVKITMERRKDFFLSEYNKTKSVPNTLFLSILLDKVKIELELSGTNRYLL